jgi:HK97 family phage prohead protease
MSNQTSDFVSRYKQHPASPVANFGEKSGLVVSRATQVVEQSEGVYRFKITTSALDRYNDIVQPGGVMLDNYKGNPVVLFNHNSTSELPIGKNLDIYAEGDGLVGITQIHSLTSLAADVLKLLKGGFLKATSIGFIPLGWLDRTPNDDEKLYPSWFGETVREYTKWEMLEYSIVNIPANPTALIQNSFGAALHEALEKNVIQGDSAIFRLFDDHIAKEFARHFTQKAATIFSNNQGKQMNPEEKAGSVLNAKNKERVRQALTLAQTSLDSAQQMVTLLSEVMAEAETTSDAGAGGGEQLSGESGKQKSESGKQTGESGKQKSEEPSVIGLKLKIAQLTEELETLRTAAKAAETAEDGDDDTEEEIDLSTYLSQNGDTK